MVMVMMMKKGKKTDELLQASAIETHCYEEESSEKKMKDRR